MSPNHNQIGDAQLLAEVAKQFKHWRATRIKRGPIPDELLSMIPRLEAGFKNNVIAKALGINCTQLRNRLNLLRPSESRLPLTLMEFSPPCPSQKVEEKIATLTFFCKNGKPASVSGLGREDMMLIIASLIGESQCCN